MSRPLAPLKGGETDDPVALCRLPGVGPAPLACAWRPDGSLVVIATDGRKLHFSAAQLAALEGAARPPGDAAVAPSLAGPSKRRRSRRA